MSFAQEVKKEIIARELPKGCCAKACAYSIACFSKHFDLRGIVLHTEQEFVAQFAQKAFQRVGIYGAITTRGKEKTGIIEFAVKDPVQVKKMLELFSYSSSRTSLHILSDNFVCEHCVNVFISTAFICSGTMTDPQKEYNLEFLSSRYNLIHDFSALLMSRGFTPRHTQRKGANVLYLKSSEQIEDLLTFMGAMSASLEVMNTKVYKDIRNRANRITNCETANIDKIVAANQNVLQAIAFLRKNNAVEALPQNLKDAIEKREAMPDVSLKELAEQFNPPLSKSGLSHRMKKIEKIAEQMKERAQNG